MTRTVWLVWAPLVFGLYHVLRTCVDEVDPVPSSMCLRPMAIMMLLTILLLWGLRFLVPGLAKRAVIVTAFYILFLNYSLLVRLMWLFPPLRPAVLLGLINPFVAFGLIAAAMAVIIVVIRRSKSDFAITHDALGIFATVLLVLLLYQSVAPFLDGSRSRWMAAADDIIDATATVDIQPVENLPDVYYIILDGYARQDVLQTLYQYDNSKFLSFLSEQGFYTPSQSSSNYPQTYLSLASSLNLSYLDELARVLPSDSGTRRPLRYLIQNNSLVQLMSRAGYRFVFLASSFPGTSDNRQADICNCKANGLSQVENEVIFQTPLAYVRAIQMMQHDGHRKRALDTLDELGAAATIPGPKFVFAHLLLPHPPFVFSSDGDPVTPQAPLMLNDGSHFPFSSEQYVSGYAAQVTFLNSKLRQAIETLVTQSPTHPIIILQADHGPGSMLDWESVENTNATERLGIFASYLAPEDMRGLISETMTPVNTFRILSNTILGTDFTIEKDQSYLATWMEPYDLVLVPVAASGTSLEP